MSSLHDQMGPPSSHHTFCFTQYDFNMARIFSHRSRDFHGRGRWLNATESDEAAFSFGDDFLRDNQQIAIGELELLALAGIADQLSDGVTKVNFRDAIQAD